MWEQEERERHKANDFPPGALRGCRALRGDAWHGGCDVAGQDWWSEASSVPRGGTFISATEDEKRGLMPREELGGIPENHEMAGPDTSLPPPTSSFRSMEVGTAPGHIAPIILQHAACSCQWASVFTPNGLITQRISP